ncbi:hypothetical protein [Staphylococcus felis]|uniref:Abi family protein n=1 Tax=Staphylococcus felis TaxID=46127 RepID=UPI0032DB64FE
MFESKTYYELVNILENEKNINVISDEHCISLLKNYGYFNLINNYKQDLKEIDNDFQSLIFKNLIKIETTLKSHLSYLMSTKFGVNESQYKNHLNYKHHISAQRVFEMSP